MSMLPKQARSVPLRAGAAGPVAARAAAELLRQAVRRHRAGQAAAAEQLCRRVLGLDADQPDALHLLGVLAYQGRRPAEAVELLSRAAALRPGDAACHGHLGAALREAGRPDQAVAAYRRALELQPADPTTHYNLGNALSQLGRPAEAEAAFRRALQLRPDHAETLGNLGNALRDQGRLDEAIDLYRRALALNPGMTKAYQNLGSVLFAQGRVDEAAQAFEDWLRVEPGQPIALHMRAALTGRGAGERAADAYVAQTFNAFAERFERSLLALGYRGPEAVLAALEADLTPGESALDILDAGCGTGLCGPLLRRHAKTLTGVDLAERMLAKAQARGVYDALEHAELTAYLAGVTARFDVIVAADTVNYFGRLEPLFAAAAGALRPAGRLVFFVEADDAPEATWRLNPHGRYSHGEGYVTAALAAAGLVVRTSEPMTIRHQFDAPVPGRLFLARAGGTGEPMTAALDRAGMAD